MPRQIASAGAALALFGIYLLAWLPAGRPSPTDEVTLWFLIVSAGLTFLPALRARIVDSEEAATFGLIAVAFVLFQLADKVHPETGFGIQVADMPEKLVFSPAWYLAVLGAAFSAPLWFRRGGPERFVLWSTHVVGVLGLGSFWYLSRFFKISVTEGMDPVPMVRLVMHIVGFGSAALCCRAAALDEKIRRAAFTGLPVALFAIWARHHFVHAPAEAAE